MGTSLGCGESHTIFYIYLTLMRTSFAGGAHA